MKKTRILLCGFGQIGRMLYRTMLRRPEFELAGVIDLDSELYLWFSGMGQVKFEFTSRTDVSAICRCIGECILD